MGSGVGAGVADFFLWFFCRKLGLYGAISVDDPRDCGERGGKREGAAWDRRGVWGRRREVRGDDAGVASRGEVFRCESDDVKGEINQKVQIAKGSNIGNRYGVAARRARRTQTPLNHL